MNIRKKLAIIVILLFVVVGLSVGLTLAHPKETPTIEVKHASKTIPAATAPIQETESGVTQQVAPLTKTQTTAPQKQLVQPSPQPTISDADKAALERAQQEIAAQEERAKKAKCSAIESQYNSDVLAENGRHTNALSVIDTDYRSRGMGYSGAYQAAKDQENNLHQANLTVIENRSANLYISYGCN